MTTTLLNLANRYDQEAHDAVSQRKRWALRDSAALFRRMVCNRAAADLRSLKLDLALLLDVAERWCHQHGYRAVVGHGGWVIQRGSEPAIVAGIGDTLTWDGQRIRVQK